MLTKDDYAKMDKLAIEFLMDYELYSFPLDIFRIARDILHAELIGYSSLSKEQLDYIESKSALEKGYTITEHLSDGTKRYKIYYNDKNNIYRQRHTIGHEIKHILLGEEDFSNDAEILADYFSKALEAPKCLMMYKNISTQEECVSNFNLSYEASGYWINTVSNRIKSVGTDLFDYERDFMNNYLKFNKKKKD